MNPAARIFEVSWEVCNKVGGIHTVLTSKLPEVLREFDGQYTAIGPYLPPFSSVEFEELAVPEKLKPVASELQTKGVQLHYGKWLIGPEPEAVLLGWDGLVPALNQYKKTYWERYQLDTLGSDYYDFDQPLLWGIAAGLFIESYARAAKDPVIVQAHEWLAAGVFLPLDEAANPQIKTVFTTHATVLGRALSSRNVPIYDRLAGIDPDKSAKEVGVVSKHQLERLGARLATVFTTVSKITAEEAEAFLGRKVDVVVENGLDSQALPAFDDLCILRKRTREQVDDFIASYFFPSHQFDLAQTRYFFTMGRYEAHNKGYDLFLSSLGSLNKQLQTEKSSKTVISLFLVATGNSGLRPEVLSHLTVYNRMREIVRQKIQVEIPIYQAIWPDGSMNTDSFAQYTDQISALVRQLTRFDEVPISPYQIDPNDTIVQLALQNGLRNRAEDRVKVLFLPVYFDGLDGLFNIPIYELVSALDLGVFPSVYEPWGYTPLESIMMGVPAVSSTLAGFGRAVSEHTETYCEGVFVLDRSGKAAEDAGLKLTSYLKTGSDESDRQWLNRRIAAYLKAQSFGWNHLYRNYSRAYALAKAGETRKS